MLLQAVEGRICLSSLGWVFGASREDLEPYLEKNSSKGSRYTRNICRFSGGYELPLAILNKVLKSYMD